MVQAYCILTERRRERERIGGDEQEQVQCYGQKICIAKIQVGNTYSTYFCLYVYFLEGVEAFSGRGGGGGGRGGGSTESVYTPFLDPSSVQSCGARPFPELPFLCLLTLSFGSSRRMHSLKRKKMQKGSTFNNKSRCFTQAWRLGLKKHTRDPKGQGEDCVGLT